MVTKQVERLPLRRPQFVMEAVTEIRQALRHRESVRGRLHGGNRGEVGPARVAGRREPFGEVAGVDTVTSRPDGEHEW